ELRPPLDRQPDFEEFWARTLSEARAVAMDARVTPAPDRSNEQVQTYKVNFAGLGGSRWYGWYCVPKGAGTYPAVVVFPGYGDRALAPPVGWARRGYAGLVIQVREHDVDLPEYEGKRYMVEGVESKEAYVFRRIYAACVRCVDFLCGRAEVAHDKIAVTGASQGGGLSLVTAALDPRVKLCMADVPFLSNYPAAVPVAGYPYREIRDYIEKHPDRREEVFEVLSYFDAMNFAPDIKCPVLMSVGLRDRTCPPAAVYGVFNHIASRKGIHVYPRLGHAVAPEQWPIKYRWMAELSGPAPAAGE
ncbi:MAG: acetylxylan esterase, partial [Armatimonadota bacterium]